MTATPIPVIMYHSVGQVMPDWQWSFLTVPYRTFEDQLKHLRQSGYCSVGLDQLYEHISGTSSLPEKSVVLTFDDGFLDNWVFAAPLLRRYDFSATVFVNPEFVDPRDIVRPTLNDLWAGKVQETALEYRGFMSWPELRLITENGIFSVQSHLMTHTWYPVSDKVIDFHHPGDGYFWLDWNACPDKKPFYLKSLQTSHVPYGTPVYENAKSLQATRYLPNGNEAQQLSAYVAKHGEESFFERTNWQDILFKELESSRRVNKLSGRHETIQEKNTRIDRELLESKHVIEEKVSAPVNFMAWPGGGYDHEVFQRATSIYKAMTVNSFDQKRTMNRPGDDPRIISRLGVPYIDYRGKVYYPGGKYLTTYLDEFRGSSLARKRRQLYKLWLLFARRVISSNLTF